MSYQGHYSPPPRQQVLYGRPCAEALASELARLGASRAVFVTNNSLAAPGQLGPRIRDALGAACVGEVTGIRAHSPREDVIRIVLALQHHHADVVIALGGGSVCDATKAAILCAENDITESDAIDRLQTEDAMRTPSIPYIMVPTTLSAGEFTAYAGVTDERVPRKEVLFHPDIAPDSVILDPAMTLATPPRLWFGTGIRAVDHFVETWCSVNVTPPCEATALHAARLLPQALRRCLAAPEDLDSRLECQIGAWLSVQGVASGVDLGASHGIGHILGGTAGMPHGETSCVMLPHVLRYNALVNADRQHALASAMGDAETPLSDQIQKLVAELGLPGALREADVPRDMLPTLAEESMLDMWIKTNPRPIESSSEVLPLLEAAW